ncbi:MAG: hypothetical protein HFE78_01075 [Clostridiales bacterium]|nr:hypothetical protein [Clostridiales bacterium]
MRILVRGLRLPFDKDERFAIQKAIKKIKPLGGVHIEEDTACIYKKSLDARKKDAISYVYTVALTVDGAYSPEQLAAFDAVAYDETPLQVTSGTERREGPIVVAGFGPCGMFCALLLAEHGYAPIVLERGGSIAERTQAVETFNRTGILNPDCNIQFGAGGAGTFSDGKLMTRINDDKCHYVLSRFCEFGAPPEIMVQAKPHIGTDRLKTVVQNMSDRIEALGGTVLYNTKLIGVETVNGSVKGVKTTRGDFSCAALVLALGHSARDTYQMISQAGMTMQPKPFSVGVRIEHLQRNIDAALYGKAAGHPKLPKGEYALSTHASGRGVYTFCMCPGGTVVAAASEEGGVVTNGMSEYARAGVNANSALCVSVQPEDYGNNVWKAVDFVRDLEQQAFRVGGSDYRAPVQTVGDFLQNRTGHLPSAVQPSYRDGCVTMANLNELLPSFVGQALHTGIAQFDRKLRGFADANALLTGVETRTSAPLRLPRIADGAAVGFDNIYPCGEGAGYAGGITSAAIDGIHCALTLIGRYKA